MARLYIPRLPRCYLPLDTIRSKMSDASCSVSSSVLRDLRKMNHNLTYYLTQEPYVDTLIRKAMLTTSVCHTWMSLPNTKPHPAMQVVCAGGRYAIYIGDVKHYYGRLLETKVCEPPHATNHGKELSAQDKQKFTEYLALNNEPYIPGRALFELFSMTFKYRDRTRTGPRSWDVNIEVRDHFCGNILPAIYRDRVKPQFFYAQSAIEDKYKYLQLRNALRQAVSDIRSTARTDIVGDGFEDYLMRSSTENIQNLLAMHEEVLGIAERAMLRSAPELETEIKRLFENINIVQQRKDLLEHVASVSTMDSVVDQLI